MKFRHFFLYALFIILTWEITGIVDFINSLKKFESSNVDLNKIDMIVVLTGASGRINTAYELFKSHDVDKMLISGVDKNVNFEILAKEFNLDQSHKDQIILDNSSKSTLENAKITASKIVEFDISSICLVTSLTHMKRSFFLFENVLKGMDVDIYYFSSNISEIDYENWWKNKKYFKLLFTEYFKYEFFRFLSLIKY